LVSKADNHTVKSMQTDLQGNFSLTGINDGQYLFARHVCELPELFKQQC